MPAPLRPPPRNRHAPGVARRQRLQGGLDLQSLKREEQDDRVVVEFDVGPAASDEEHGPERRILTRADEELADGARHQALDDNAIERHSRVPGEHGGHRRLDLGCVPQPERDRAGVDLMRNRAARELHDDREAELRGGRRRFGGGAGRPAGTGTPARSGHSFAARSLSGSAARGGSGTGGSGGGRPCRIRSPVRAQAASATSPSSMPWSGHAPAASTAPRAGSGRTRKAR